MSWADVRTTSEKWTSAAAADDDDKDGDRDSDRKKGQVREEKDAAVCAQFELPARRHTILCMRMGAQRRIPACSVVTPAPADNLARGAPFGLSFCAASKSIFTRSNTETERRSDPLWRENRICLPACNRDCARNYPLLN